MVAYGIYKTSKREWITEFAEQNARTPNDQELSAYAATWTPQLLQNANDAASSALAAYAESVIEEARPGILKDALKGSGVRAVLLNMLAALLYTVALIFVVIVLKWAGVDLLSLTSGTQT